MNWGNFHCVFGGYFRFPSYRFTWDVIFLLEFNRSPHLMFLLIHSIIFLPSFFLFYVFPTGQNLCFAVKPLSILSAASSTRVQCPTFCFALILSFPYQLIFIPKGYRLIYPLSLFLYQSIIRLAAITFSFLRFVRFY